uniref:T26-2p n=1 Tax=Thermococcus sp. 26/2 TaxID=758583 RepID=D6MY25_9EURY|nr:t26-2p [Thermococcus sp. 26/2]
MAQSSRFVRGVYIDKDVEMRAKALAKVKGASFNQVVREAIIKLYRMELGNVRPEEILQE